MRDRESRTLWGSLPPRAIAQAAHVSRRTVFNSVGGKATLLKLAVDWAIVGDDEPIPLSDRPAVKAIKAEPDPRKALALWAQIGTEIAAWVAPISEVLTAAADADLTPPSSSPKPTATRCSAPPRSSDTWPHWTAWPRHHPAARRRPVLGPHGRPPLPPLCHPARLDHQRLHALAVQQPCRNTAAHAIREDPLRNHRNRDSADG